MGLPFPFPLCALTQPCEGGQCRVPRGGGRGSVEGGDVTRTRVEGVRDGEPKAASMLPLPPFLLADAGEEDRRARCQRVCVLGLPGGRGRANSDDDPPRFHS